MYPRSYILFAAIVSAGLSISCNSESEGDSANRKDTVGNEIPEEQTNVVKGKDGDIFYEDRGRGGTPVVFLHSFGGSTVHWAPQLEHLWEKQRAVAIDLRGHGKSSPPANGDYSINSMAADLSAVIGQLQLDSFILVGHSIGGAVAIAYAGIHPEKVEGLLLVGTPGKSSPEQAKMVISSLESEKYDTVMEQYMRQMLTDANPEVEKLEREGMQRFSQETNIKIIKAVFDYDPLPTLKSYKGPIMIVSPAKEIKQPNTLASQLPSVERTVVEGTSHWIQLDKPTEFNMILDRFVNKVDSTKGK